MANTSTPATTVATPTNAGGSNKSISAPKVGVPAGVKKWLGLTVGAIAVTIGIVLIASVVNSPEQKPEQKQAEKALTLSMSAHGDSPHVSPPKDHTLSPTGYGFEVHCVYDPEGKDDRIVGNPVNPCVRGPILYYYLHDTSGRANMATVQFVRPPS